ncbi:MAG: Permease of the drug/metabolite transporter (DMT) superfamily [uncultured Chthoniobacterales bacterium]|uniref:Permease of the drug/metabolite transporter (DMT) superfamily n=1 Tax=uncultured Chthoniobacterales bacterium TaxID=1836801 RepID=A0A6J4HDU2_9BACT|nr:MAG: Permease of the drug/metabolite transporter (DMT) superfamily [uncultured Chthoniobacterales bacterium]
MIAFASNSLLCRFALRETRIDPASFTAIRIVSGALVLWLIVRLRAGGTSATRAGSWRSALALFGYAAAFSFAYTSLSAGTGALLLFGAVQATMILWGLGQGEALRRLQVVGLLLAICGLVVLVFPGLAAPPLVPSILMLVAGIAWGIYSLRGKGAADPIAATAGNFLFAVPFATALGAVLLPWARIDLAGAVYALLSGALASGVGYAIWYTALRGLKAASAATVQLSVPVLTAVAGVLLLGEALTLRSILASAAILGGITLVVRSRDRAPSER